MDTFLALLALCEENPPVIREFSSQRPVNLRESSKFYFDLRLKNDWANNRDAGDRWIPYTNGQ